jgi:hypothetical protein
VENRIVQSSIHRSPSIRPERLAKARKLSPNPQVHKTRMVKVSKRFSRIQ